MVATEARMQARGKVRREELVQAALELLGEKPLDEISLADIAERADIPTGSAYHFFSNMQAVFAALAARFGEELEEVVSVPIELGDDASWTDIVDLAIDRSVTFYTSNPGYRELILGGKTPPEIKYSDRQHDETVGQYLIQQVDSLFVLPDIPRINEIFFTMVEIIDLLYQLSYMKNGELTKEAKTEAKLAAHAYLNIYLPRVLPRRPRS